MLEDGPEDGNPLWWWLFVSVVMMALGVWLIAATAPAAELPDPNAAPLVVSVTAGALATLTGDTATDVKPEGFVDVEGPLLFGKTSIGRAYARLGIATQPGQPADLSSPQNYQSAEVGFGLGRVVGSEAGLARTLVVVEAGFATRLPGDPQPRDRVVRYFGLGARLQQGSGASITVLWGRDQAAGDFGIGQLMLYGRLPVTLTRGIVCLVGNATVSPGQAGSQRDIVRIGIAADLGAALELLK